MKQRFEQKPASGWLLIPVSEHDHIQGLHDAPLTLVEYGDFECPYCGEAYLIVKTVQETLGKRLRFVYRYFPLRDKHPHAEMAAEAAEAAGEQGAFWEMHDLLYENQDALDEENLIQYAEDLDLNVNRFIREIEDGEHRERILADYRGGLRSEVQGTPTFFVNGQIYSGPLEAEVLVSELTQTSAIPR